MKVINYGINHYSFNELDTMTTEELYEAKRKIERQLVMLDEERKYIEEAFKEARKQGR